MAGTERYLKVGPYILMETLGVGSFGKVKVALHSVSHQRFACKILNKRLVRERVLSQQVQKEIDIMQRLRHRNTVSLVSVLSTSTKVFIVMELVRGGELYDEIQRHKRLSEPYARFYFRQLIEGLQHCHDHGVYHRDLKPENLLLDEYNTLKITDFGLSALKASVSSGAESVTGSLTLHTQCGTPNYVAPEIINLDARGYSGAKVDAWSCGIILYVLVAGALPFDDDEMDVLFKRILRCDLSYPSFFSESLIDLISNLLKTEPIERYSLADVRQHPWYNDAEVHTGMYADEPVPDDATPQDEMPCLSSEPGFETTPPLREDPPLTELQRDHVLEMAPLEPPLPPAPPLPVEPVAMHEPVRSKPGSGSVPSAATVPDVTVAPVVVTPAALSSSTTSPRSVSPDPITHDMAGIVSGQASLLMKFSMTNNGVDAGMGRGGAGMRTDSLDFGTRVESVESQLAAMSQGLTVHPDTLERIAPVQESSMAESRATDEADVAEGVLHAKRGATTTASATARVERMLEGEQSFVESIGPLSRFRSHVLGGMGDGILPNSDDDNDSELEEAQELPQSLFVGKQVRGQNGPGASSDNNPTERRAYSMNDIEGEEPPETGNVQRDPSMGDPGTETRARMRRRVKRQLWDRAAELWRTPAHSYHLGSKNFGLPSAKEISPLHLSHHPSPSSGYLREVEVIGVRKSQSIMESVSLGTAMFAADALPSKRKSMLGVSPASRKPKLVRSSSHDGTVTAVSVRRRPRVGSRPASHDDSTNHGPSHRRDKYRRATHELITVEDIDSSTSDRKLPAQSSPQTSKGKVRSLLNVVRNSDSARAASKRRPPFRPDKDWVKTDADKMVWCKMMKDYDMIPDFDEFEMDSSMLNDLWTAGLSRENFGRKHSFAASRFGPQPEPSLLRTTPSSRNATHSISKDWLDSDRQPNGNMREGLSTSLHSVQRSTVQETHRSADSSSEHICSTTTSSAESLKLSDNQGNASHTNGKGTNDYISRKSSSASSSKKKQSKRRVTIASVEATDVTPSTGMNGHRTGGVQCSTSVRRRTGPTGKSASAEELHSQRHANRESDGTLSSMPSHMQRERPFPRSSSGQSTPARLTSRSYDDTSEAASKTDSPATSMRSFGSSHFADPKDSLTASMRRGGSVTFRLGEDDVLPSAKRVMDANAVENTAANMLTRSQSPMPHSKAGLHITPAYMPVTQLAPENVDLHNALVPGKLIERRSEAKSNGSDVGTAPSAGSTLDAGGEEIERNGPSQSTAAFSNSPSASQHLDASTPVSPFLLDIPGPRVKHIPASNPLFASLLPSVSSAKARFRKPSSPLVVKSCTHFHSLMEPRRCFVVLQELLRAYGSSSITRPTVRGESRYKIRCDSKKGVTVVSAVIIISKLDDGLSAVQFKKKGKTDPRQFTQFYNDVYKMYCEKSKAGDGHHGRSADSEGPASTQESQLNGLGSIEMGGQTPTTTSIRSGRDSFLRTESSGSAATVSSGFRRPGSSTSKA